MMQNIIEKSGAMTSDLDGAEVWGTRIKDIGKTYFILSVSKSSTLNKWFQIH